jgi:hypothetical protein
MERGYLMKKLLPIGSVVLLNEAEKRLMIFGWLPETEEKQRYDYIGCYYPEGFIDADQNFLFNHEQISKIDYIGFADVEFQLFVQRVSDELEKHTIN